MKLITLNIWGGILYEPLINFISKYAETADIFCFQEVLFGTRPQFTPQDKARENIFGEISDRLIDFTACKFTSDSKHFQFEAIDFPAGQAIFIRKSLNIQDQGKFHCYDDTPENVQQGGKLTGNLAWVDIEKDNRLLTVANLHGLWQKDTHKLDTPERIIQSKKIKDFFEKRNNQKILCGDFNLVPDGKSMNILEQGMVNMIKQYDITSTRSKYYRKYSQRGASQYADYILISPDIRVNTFKVFQDDISDHLPLLLDFN